MLMKIVAHGILTIALWLFFFLDPVLGMRCGNELVQLGDARVVVLSKCGEPDDVVVSYREERIGNAFVTMVVETWTYNLGPRDFLHFLVFEDGRLVNINTGRYGF